MTDRRDNRGRRSDDLWTRIIGALLIILVLELLILLVAQFVPIGVDSDQNAEIQRIPLEAAYDTREASFNRCVSTNPRNVAQVQAALDQAAGNRARADAWRILASFPLDPALDEFTRGQIAANEHEAANADRFAHVLVRANREVAKDPDDRDFAHRASVDCRQVYPLPAHRGDPLPEPTKP